LCCAAAIAEDRPLERFEFSKIEMGTQFKIICYARDERSASSACQAAFARVAQLNSLLSDYDPQSELNRLCDTGGTGRWVVVSPELWRVLQHAQQLSERSEGAFDITVGPLVRLWKRALRTRQLPDAQRLAEAQAAVGYRHVQLDARHRAVRLGQRQMQLDLGGIAKGYAADEALRVLQRHGITAALVDAGGDLVAGDAPPGSEGWRIGIAPLHEGGPPSRVLLLARRAAATSGDAWQHVVIDGRRYSHIVDPRTGLGLTDHSSVTVTAADGMTADALATAVSVLGPQRGLQLVDQTCGAAALVVRNVDGQTETHTSRRWNELPLQAAAAGAGAP
jgi:thiamine biosynthesis lipoprotein